MEARDFLALAAIGISLWSLGVTYSQRSREMKRSVRSQMNALVVEIVKLLRSDPQQTDTDAGDSGQAQRAILLTRQAVYLSNQEPKLITDIEFSTIAQGLWVAGDFQLAEQFWRKSIDTASSDFMKVVGRRGYAMYLFGLGKIEEGRRQYSLGLEIADNSTDINKAMNAQTYMLWLESEARNSFWDDALQKYQRAKGIIESMGSFQLRQAGKEMVEKLRERWIPVHGLGQGPIPTDLAPPDTSWPKPPSD